MTISGGNKRLFGLFAVGPGL